MSTEKAHTTDIHCMPRSELCNNISCAGLNKRVSLSCAIEKHPHFFVHHFFFFNCVAFGTMRHLF